MTEISTQKKPTNTHVLLTFLPTIYGLKDIAKNKTEKPTTKNIYKHINRYNLFCVRFSLRLLQTKTPFSELMNP